jgi:hypothetical protein
MTKKKIWESVQIWYGLIMLAVVFLLIAFFVFINEPIGDDVLGHFAGGITYYLDDFDHVLGDRISSLGQCVNSVILIYRYWSGRMTGYILNAIGVLLPAYILAIISALIYTSNIFLAMRIAYKDSKKALEHPLAILISFLAVYWVRDAVYYTYMWTMTSIYSFGVMLCLLYYNLSVIDDNKHNILLCSIVGFFAGFSHEVISLLLIVMIGIDWAIKVERKNNTWTDILRHAGLGIGYLLCFTAPGNFYRMSQSHDKIDNTLNERVISSINLHINALIGTKGSRNIFLVMFVLAVISVIVIWRKEGKIKILRIAIDNIGFVIAGIISILVWSFFASNPPYAMEMWVFMVYVVILRVIDEALKIPHFEIINGVCIIMALALLVVLYSAELKSFAGTAIKRKSLIKEAVYNGDSQVTVPKYDEDILSYRYSLNDLNNQEEYDSAHYRAYYGIRIVIEE